MAILIQVLAAGVTDNSGNPLDSGKAYIYEVGTTNPVDSWQDADLNTLHPNPVILDSVGRAEVFVNEDVRVLIKDADDNTILDIDAIGSITSFPGSIQIGTNDTDVLDLNSSIDGDLIPITDSTYDVGSNLKRWENGFFDNIDASSIKGNITAAAANTPGWISNLGLTLSGGVMTITGADGTTISSSNPGYVTIASATENLFKSIKVTSSITLKDDNNASSNLTNIGFGITEAVDWADPMPFFLYALNRNDTDIDGTDGNSCFFISRSPAYRRTPTGSTTFGSFSAAPSSDSVFSIFLLGNYTVANYTNKEVELIGGFYATWLASTADWTIDFSPASSDRSGLGQANLEFMFQKSYSYPLSQNGAATGTYSLANGGTAPVFSSNTAQYQVKRDGYINYYIDIQGDGGTDGSGGVDFILKPPVAASSSAPSFVGYGQCLRGGTTSFILFKVDSGTGGLTLEVDNGTNLNNSNFSAGNRTVIGTIRYKAF